MSNAPHQLRLLLRKQLRQKRRELSDFTQQQNSIALNLNLLKLFDTIETTNIKIAVYLANDGEINLTPFIEPAWQENFILFLPVLDPNNKNFLVFLPYIDNRKLIKNKFGIKEPLYNKAECYHAQDMDIILMPLVGFDRNGNRLGMGGGFYDRSLDFMKHKKAEKPILIGVAHDIQELDKIPVENWDIPLNYLITNKEIIKFS
ncbi:MAG: 5-formyltetrahydrofolate cyclo-ligase [Gammaproteobacteria bacterium]|nr:5-formyltetrahydrofolate cyclo-ligase [Gammaproteobacteria bacterium]